MIYRKIALAAAAFALIGETDALGVGIRAAPSVLMRPIDVRAAKHEPGAHAFLFCLYKPCPCVVSQVPAVASRAKVEMGRGDKRTKKGKRKAGSFGNSRPRNSKIRIQREGAGADLGVARERADETRSVVRFFSLRLFAFLFSVFRHTSCHSSSAASEGVIRASSSASSSATSGNW